MLEKITSSELYNRYKDGPDAKSQSAEKILVEGIATYLGPDMYGLPSIEFGTSKNDGANILCVLAEPEYANVKIGSKVTILGNFYGFVQKTVVMKKCEVKEVI
nr:hypothetical protein [Enterococcus timonensis]